MTAIQKHEGGAITTGTGGPMDAMIALAQQGVAPELMERMLDMQERILSRDARMAFHEAMAAFKAECPPAPKVSKGAVRSDGSKKTTQMFAGLDVIAEHIRPYLARHGLSYRYETEIDEKMTRIICVVAHVMGHEERSAFACLTSDAAVPGANKVQIGGSAMSYGMRYSLLAAFGLTSAIPDDDGETAGRAPSEPITEGQAADLRALADEVGANHAGFLSMMGVKSFADIPVAAHGVATSLLESKRKGGA
jgi:hypothetical protein